MNEHMNIFIPYEKNEPQENHLTRSFLLLLKYSPSIFYMFYNCVYEKCHEEDINLENIYNKELQYYITTQVGCKNAIDYTNDNILSILITNEDLELNNSIHCSDRTAIYDGVISVNDNLTFIIENKPNNKDVWEDQLSVGQKLGQHIKGNGCTLIQKPIILTWREIFKRLANLECSNVEKKLIDDFLDFVYRKYSEMFPYEKFIQCKDNRHLLDLRIEKLLKNIVSKENEEKVEYHRNWANKINYPTKYINQIDYRPVLKNNSNIGNNYISIYFCCGSNVQKSRNLFTDIDLNKLTKLNNYYKRLNICINDSYGRTICLIPCKKGLEDNFIQYWKDKDNNKKIGQAPTLDILSLIENILNFDFLEDFDLNELKDKINNRTLLRICPVLDMEYHIDFATIYSLESKGQIEQEFVDKTVEALKVFNDDKGFIKLLKPEYNIQRES